MYFVTEMGQWRRLRRNDGGFVAGRNIEMISGVFSSFIIVSIPVVRFRGRWKSLSREASAERLPRYVTNDNVVAHTGQTETLHVESS